VQMLMNAPQYANRFRSMTEETRGNIQADLSRDLVRITEHLNNTLPQERRENVQRLVFQTLGGLDSPVLNLNTVEVLGLSDAQRGQMKAVFDDMQEERTAQMEKMLGIAEKVIAVGGPRNLVIAAGGPQNLSPEEQAQLAQLRKEVEALHAETSATARKLTERVRQYLTPEQLERERQLIASRPAFLPPLPRELRQENREEETGGGYIPGAGAWRPGQSVPTQNQEPRSNRFPRGAGDEE